MKILSSIVRVIAAVLIFLSSAYLVLQAPQMHSEYMRNKVGATVSLLNNGQRTGGGTGFQVTTSKGVQYTLTNRHVCRMDKPINTLVNGKRRTLKIVKVSSKTDLCVLEAIKELRALDLASSVKIGEGIAALGHPQLLPLALTRGELMGYASVGIGEAMVFNPAQCPKATEPVMSLFGVICVREYKAGVTNVTILPGSSGSPMVNFWGNLVGVVFAANNSSNWGLVIPLNEVREFLESL
jgi:S1-C subfamily serine protease